MQRRKIPFNFLSLLCVDALSFVLSLWASVKCAAADQRWAGLGEFVWLHVLVIGGLLLTFALRGFYTRRTPFWNELRNTFHLLLAGSAAAGALLMLLDAQSHRGLWLLMWGLAFLAIPSLRFIAKHALARLGLWRRSAIIIGVGPQAMSAASALYSEPLLGFNVMAFIGVSRPAQSLPPSMKVCGHDVAVLTVEHDELLSLLESYGRPHLVVALERDEMDATEGMLSKLSLRYPDMNIIPPLPRVPLFGVEVSYFFSHDILMLRFKNNLAAPLLRQFKRLVDLVGASVLLVLLAPLMLFIMARIYLEDGGPVIYYQDRLGHGGKRFRFYKFRSMVRNADQVLAAWEKENPELFAEYKKSNFKLANDPRVLKVGRLIRSSSIDELPQLWNVLKGDMSLVGPRPLLPRELDDYGDSFNDYYVRTRPGITGLWQVSGRSQTTFADRISLDEWYIKNWNLWYDIAILFKTVRVVVLREGAY